MYNNTDTHTGSAVSRDTKDRSVLLHLPSTVKSQLGRKHHKMAIAQWNVRTLLDRETTNIPERRTALVAMELAKYNIDIVVLSETRFHASGSLNDLEYTFYWSGKPNGEKRDAGVGFAIKRDIVAKLTEMPHPVSDRIMTMRIPLTKDRNATIVNPNNDEPRGEQEDILQSAKGYTQKHPQYRQAPADRRLQCKDRKRK